MCAKEFDGLKYSWIKFNVLKSKIGWELTKNGCQDFQKSHICVVFKLIIPITVVFMHLLGL